MIVHACRAAAALVLFGEFGGRPAPHCFALGFRAIVALLIVTSPALAAPSAEDFRSDAMGLEALINANYAYLDRLPDGQFVFSDKLRVEANRVADQPSLLRFAERVLTSLADHHAITGSSLADSWAVVPSYSDLWIEKQGPTYVITAVRAGSPAEAAGVAAGDHLVAIGGASVDRAVASFWADIGSPYDDERASFAARILAAGRRDRARELSVRRGSRPVRVLGLPNLYGSQKLQPPLQTDRKGERYVIKLNDSLGSSDTILAFDAFMARVPAGADLVIDLTETPSGGNTVVARAILGWFVAKPSPYQVHALPAEERETTIPRQWVEQVLARHGKYRARLPEIQVGRWTGSMGEGLAIGFAALGAPVRGGRMAGLLGAIYDYELPNSGLVIKLPTERLMTVDGTPREKFVAGD